MSTRNACFTTKNNNKIHLNEENVMRFEVFKAIIIMLL
jgi:hypothetical protein